MAELASGSDPVAIGGLLLSLVLAVCGGTAFLFKTFRTKDEPIPTNGETGLVTELREQIDDLRDSLEQERRGRAEDNRRHEQNMRDLERRMGEMQTKFEVSQAQLLEAYRRLGDSRGQVGI